MQKMKIIQYNNHSVQHFDYEELGIQGVGVNRTPIINMDKFIDHSYDDELNAECYSGLALCEGNYKMGMFWGDLPPEEEQRLNGKSWTTILANIEEHDPTGIHRQAIDNILQQNGGKKAIYRYIYFAMGGVIPWFFGLYLKENHFATKTKNGKYNEEVVKYFPKLLDYLESLPFKDIGRVLFFTTYPSAGVATHRDANMAPHKDHNINLFFSSGRRPSFIWDEKIKQKHYLEDSARSYFFNNRDHHGVDPEPRFRYTLRVDGTFTDELCDQLGLIDGYTWHPDYIGKIS
jgi:hypothetical protein